MSAKPMLFTSFLFRPARGEGENPYLFLTIQRITGLKRGRNSPTKFSGLTPIANKVIVIAKRTVQATMQKIVDLSIVFTTFQG